MQIKTIRSLQGLNNVKNYWEKWQTHPNCDFTHFELICKLRPEVQSPLVTIVEKDGEPCTMLVARLQNTRFSQRIGYFVTAGIPARVLSVIYQGVLGRLDKEVGELLVKHIWSLLVSGEADVAEFHYLPEHSALLSALRENSPQRYSHRKPAWNIHWSMTLHNDPEFLLKKLKSKHRSWIRKKQKELELAFPSKVSWRWMNHFNDMPGLCKLLEGVAAQSYQRQLGAGFVDDEEHRQRFELFASRGQLRIQILEIDGRVMAFWIGIVYKGVFHSMETCYESSLSKYEVGTQIFLRMLDGLVREGVKTLDFGLGDAIYKQRFGDQHWRETTLSLFAPTLKGMALRLSLEFFGSLDRAGRHLVQKFDTLDRLKTGWRRRLMQSSSRNKPN